MIKDQIQADLKQAQLNKDSAKVDTLRMLWSAIRYGEIDQVKEFTDDEVIIVVQKEIKKRKEASEGFRTGGREQSALKEEAEAQVLSQYLPAQLSDEELSQIVSEAIAQTGAKTISDMGKVIGTVMGKVAGKAEGKRVSTMVKDKLS